MNCKFCGYRLWNLPARLCPECGNPFRPGDFEFIPNSVQYCCPECDQQYYGTDVRGHLVPQQFYCVRCESQLHMDQMVLRPTANVTDAQTEADHNPWLARRNVGWFRGWSATVGRGMVDPVRLIRATPIESSNSEALSFLALTTLVYYVVGAIPWIAFTLMVGWGAGAGRGLMALPWMLFWLGGSVITGVFVAIWGLSAHWILRWTGNVAGGLGRTYASLCYCAGANAFVALPCLNCYFQWFGWIWWIVSATLMVSEGQKVSGGRASLAVLTAPLVTVLVAFGGIVASIFWFSQSNSTFTSSGGGGTSTLTAAVVQQITQTGTGPSHALELATTGSVWSGEFINAPSTTSEADVPIGQTTLDQFEAAPAASQTAMAAAAAAALPPEVVAHRLGDFVFTYHGMTSSNSDPGLWVVVMCPDPAVNPGWSGVVEVGPLDGGTLSYAYPSSQWTQALSTQNQLRAVCQLAPLPDPSTVTHTAAATGSPPAPMPFQGPVEAADEPAQ